MDVKTFRDNMYSMKTRRFGKVMELLVKKLIDGENGQNIHHDLSLEDSRIEVKFSRAEKKHNQGIDENTVVDVIESEGIAVRMFPYVEAFKTQFDCNIQQIKPKEFDRLIYGVLFADRIVIFSMKPFHLMFDSKVAYSNKQHKGNFGEGQFHINQSNIDYHVDTFHMCTLSYADALALLRHESKEAQS